MKGTRWLIIVALLAALALPLFAGGQGDAAAAAVTVNPRGVLPIVNEKITISVFRNQDPLILDFDDNYQTKWLEEQTNVNVEWMLVPSQQIAEKMNLLLASGTDLPDVCMQATSRTTMLKYAEEGIFLPLNKYIDEYAVELNKIIADLEGYDIDLMLGYTAPDGNVYGLPTVSTCKWCETIWRSWVDTRWLETLGLEIPTTVDEFYDMLVAFKTQDPNGNGKAKTNGQSRATTTDKPDDQGVAALIEQAEAVKVSLRDSLTKTSELISALKRHRKQSKAVRTALISLRRLQAVDA